MIRLKELARSGRIES